MRLRLFAGLIGKKYLSANHLLPACYALVLMARRSANLIHSRVAGASVCNVHGCSRQRVAEHGWFTGMSAAMQNCWF